ncbi:hypothetical protein J2Z37_002243 [Ammoniphilus resinae]|uniref:Uncharacterized protein n=1 Tax=Ammoniphilus resinae TaxID=861532 RepID=A0ABS4GQC3_9BACL|nr:hypothetical protein [Ammoniphilus resinae]
MKINVAEQMSFFELHRCYEDQCGGSEGVH